MANNLLRLPLSFLGRFLLVSSLLSLVWKVFSGLYLFTVIPAVNLLFWLEGLHIRLEQRRQTLLMLYQDPEGSVQIMQFLGHEEIYLSLIAAVALLAATPGLTGRRRLRWIAAALTLFWGMHVFGIHAGGHLALEDYLQTISAEGTMTGGREGIFGFLFAAWSTWGSLAFTVAIWILAGAPSFLSPPEEED